MVPYKADHVSQKKTQTIMPKLSWELVGAYAIVGAVWSITPLSWLFVLYQLVLPTFFPSYRALPTHGLIRPGLSRLLLAYTVLEVLFSIYHCYLTVKAQRRWPAQQLLRRDLRALWMRTLYNGREQPDFPFYFKNGGSPASSINSFESSTPPLLTSPPLKDNSATEFKELLRYWFKGASFESLRRSNMLDFVAWSIYNCHYEELVDERVEWEKRGRPPTILGEQLDEDDELAHIKGDRLSFVEHCVEMVEKRTESKFPEGKNPKVKPIRLTLDPVRVRSRPLLLYLLIHYSQKKAVRPELGFMECQEEDLSYILRIPEGWEATDATPESKRPLLLLHGLGAGTLQYSELINHLATSPALKDRPILILLQPHISMSIFSKSYLTPPDSKTCTEGLLRIAALWGFNKTGITVLSHSNGSVAHGWLLRVAPELCVRSCFVDPIPFCIWEPWVCWNFLYAPVRTPFEVIMRYFLARELGIALTLQRAFSWTSNLLLATQIPNLRSQFHTAFHLAENDSIINTPRIRNHLLEHGVSEMEPDTKIDNGLVRGGLRYHLGTRHGESMTKGREEIVKWLAGGGAPERKTTLELDDEEQYIDPLQVRI